MIILIISLIILLGIVLYAGKKACDMAIKKDVAKKHISLIFSRDEMEELKIETEKYAGWLDNHSQEVEIISRDGLKLKGYEVKNGENNPKWAIIVHGYLGSGSDLVKFAKHFIELGYNALIIDLRAHGKSEGEYIGMGWLDHFDVELWIQWILEKEKNAEIILFGISMGAATVMMTTGENLPANVKLAIADCGYSSVWDEFKMHLKKIFHLPTFPILYAASLMSKIYAGYTYREASSVNQVKKSKTPTLFIHGTKDKFVPYEMLEKIYKSANCEKEKLEIEGAAHAESELMDTGKYWETIQRFINKHM